MNQEFKLKMQAWLDGELPSAEAASLSQAIAANPQAQQMLAGLKAVKAAMASNELEVKVPETREFYWSQIQRRIVREENKAAATPVRESFMTRWRRILFPVAGLAGALALVLVSMHQSGATGDFIQTTYTSSDMESLTFQDHSSGMTVVWLQNRPQSAATPDFKLP